MAVEPPAKSDKVDLGTPELTKLWNLSRDNLEGCRTNKRYVGGRSRLGSKFKRWCFAPRLRACHMAVHARAPQHHARDGLLLRGRHRRDGPRAGGGGAVLEHQRAQVLLARAAAAGPRAAALLLRLWRAADKYRCRLPQGCLEAPGTMARAVACSFCWPPEQNAPRASKSHCRRCPSQEKEERGTASNGAAEAGEAERQGEQAASMDTGDDQQAEAAEEEQADEEEQPDEEEGEGEGDEEEEAAEENAEDEE